MKLNLNNNDLYVLKHAKCENCIFHNHMGLCVFGYTMCLKDAGIFKSALYNSNIFNL